MTEKRVDATAYPQPISVKSSLPEDPRPHLPSCEKAQFWVDLNPKAIEALGPEGFCEALRELNVPEEMIGEVAEILSISWKSR